EERRDLVGRLSRRALAVTGPEPSAGRAPDAVARSFLKACCRELRDPPRGGIRTPLEPGNVPGNAALRAGVRGGEIARPAHGGRAPPPHWRETPCPAGPQRRE